MKQSYDDRLMRVFEICTHYPSVHVLVLFNAASACARAHAVARGYILVRLGTFILMVSADPA